MAERITHRIHDYVYALLLPLFLCAISAQGEPIDVPEVNIVNLRIGLEPNRTRLVFDLSKPATYKYMILENPSRIVVDIMGGKARFDHSMVPLVGTPVGKIRTGQQPDGTLRFVLDMEAEAQPKLFSLSPDHGRGHRIVVDLHSAVLEPKADQVAVTLAVATPTTKNEVAALATPVEEPGNNKRSQAVPPVSGGAGKAGRERKGELSGAISLDGRVFFHSPAFPGQENQNISTAFEPEYRIQWAEGHQLLSVRPFFRYDSADDERTHADLRELYWQLKYDRWVVRSGVDVTFWGVTESNHLVDIINQTDLVENIDGEDKLGQPMVNAAYDTDWGNWQVFIMPWFRERTFPGSAGRLRSEWVVDTDRPLYESSKKDEHTDLALRWSHYLGDWDIGLAHFSGTSRAPILLPEVSTNGTSLLPYYQQIDQTSLDLQVTKGAWLWKLETIYNRNNIDNYYAYAGGFEYTSFGIASSTLDFGWLLEYSYDQRGELSSTALQNDLYLGLRMTANDIQSSALLAGIFLDMDKQSSFASIEASRRLGELWTLSLELRLFSNVDADDLLYSLEDDDYLEIELSRHF